MSGSANSSGRPFLRVLDPGLGVTVQDRGRSGWRRFGVPLGGWIDAHAAACANRLLDNPLAAPVLEMRLQGARFEVLEEGWLSFCGAEIDGSLACWRATPVRAGQVVRFVSNRSGVWGYLAVVGGIAAPRILDSVSHCARASLGEPIVKETVLGRRDASVFKLPPGVSGRCAAPEDRRDPLAPPPLKVRMGPQWKLFSMAERERFLTGPWVVSSQSDRVGYRLEGTPLSAGLPEMISEPLRVGTVQIPPGGLPIVTMPDGPTVGGYPAIALVERDSLSWLAQCRPGQTIRFELVHEN